ncbi:tRNA uridine-5-carboxymethylaminomethyl(34) synthesis GTPase MnmE [Flaviflagellibacter deserti]|uniref:tRNA modification GTPase MnmE n=1 Tax=Flaviflagellibacter deserti TaxID=2267266 RepID=A0ABV9Z7D3_9HYPH
MPESSSTIYALASGTGLAGIAVVRVSGPRSSDVLITLAGKLPVPRRATFVVLRDPASSEDLDQGLVLWFPAPGSFTGEDVAEFHIHGGRASVSGLLQALGKIEGCRIAEPGEFSRRAFESGKLDLVEAEALADLIAADTAAQRRQALRGLSAGIGLVADAWRADLIRAMSFVEAEIDFSDEGDVGDGLWRRAEPIIVRLIDDIEALLTKGRSGERLREGAVVVLSGPPNVGKSSFLNRVAGRDVAIVSAYAGTTRDMLEVHLDLGGYPVTMIDTAGIRETNDPIEQEALARARKRSENADLVLWFSDAGESGISPTSSDRMWSVVNKIDLSGSLDSEDGVYPVSAKTGAGIDRLLSDLGEWAKTAFAPSESALVTRERHRLCLGSAVDALRRALLAKEPELRAEELRLSARELGRISGRVDVEDVLGGIFSEFCVGK